MNYLNYNASNSLVTFNCKSIKRSVEGVRQLCKTMDIVALQETWLFPYDLPYLGTVDADFGYTGTSAIDIEAGLIAGRPYGGVALLWRKSVFPNVSVIPCVNPRICAVKIALTNKSLIVCSVYMPTDCRDNLNDFTDCLSVLNAIIDEHGVESVFILGDFNAHPSELFYKELCNFCGDQSWICADVSVLDILSDTYTYVSDSNGSRRWLDHCLVTESAWKCVTDANVMYDVYWSDHYPLVITCNLNIIRSKINIVNFIPNTINWGVRSCEQVDEYYKLCHESLKYIDFPDELQNCCHKHCDIEQHKICIDNLYDRIVSVLANSASESSSVKPVRSRKFRKIEGWNKHVGDAHREARARFLVWVEYGKPKSGPFFERMAQSRKIFKGKLKWCQNHQEQIRMDALASLHQSRKFGKFWKSTSKLNPRPGLPVSVDGSSDPVQIANMFKNHFVVRSPLNPTRSVFAAEPCSGSMSLITSTTIKNIIKSMTRGKSPGHDGLSIEHLQNAGPHLPRVLALLFNVCLVHSYLPQELMRTIVVPILKNKTGDVSARSNYRPISLATIVAKVLDGVLDSQLSKYLNIHELQFGFTNGLSTENAILALKHAITYYTNRKTPVYACFLDLSKAFDLVDYDKLWMKVRQAGLPAEFVSIFKYWYGHQSNRVKWANVYSEEYVLECGVRQGGLTSPKLFNLYVNALIEELSSTRVGCHVGNVCVNNISYADDMVLLAPSIGALRRLLNICESYATAHGLFYNITKSMFMVFKAKNKSPEIVPPVSLYGSPLSKVTQVKYLGHIINDTLSDDADIERERRSLAKRANMLARRFVRCSDTVKITLFKTYCTSFYSSSLWVNFTQKSFSVLRIQYNNAFRALLRLPRHCSASGMFADAQVDSFPAILRKKAGSLLRRIRDSRNSVMEHIANSGDCPLIGKLVCRTKALFNLIY